MKFRFTLPLLLASTAAYAGKDSSYQVQLAGGVMVMDPMETLGHAIVVTPRFQWMYKPSFGFELESGFLIGGETRIGQFGYFAASPKLGIIGNLNPDGWLQPLIMAGPGLIFKKVNCTADESPIPCQEATALDSTFVDPDVDFMVKAGPGVQIKFGDTPLRLRTDLQWVVNLGTESFRNRGDAFVNWEWSLGLGVAFGGTKDKDKDGITDDIDACITEAEDFDQFKDEDGCPELDNDGDGIVDSAEECDNDAEDMDQFEDADGCPDKDNDKDGILDESDKCRNEAEDVDDYKDTDGCPDPEVLVTPRMVDSKTGKEITVGRLFVTAKDGSKKQVTAGNPVELIPGDYTINGTASNYTPAELALTVVTPGGFDIKLDPVKKTKIVVSRDRIELQESVKFDTGKATIQKASFGLLDEVVTVLKDYGEIKKMRVEGHTDDKGNDASNQKLSDERAASVMKYLVDHGIDAARLSSIGFGETKPLVPNKTDADRAKNRRVDMFIESWVDDLKVIEDDGSLKRPVEPAPIQRPEGAPAPAPAPAPEGLKRPEPEPAPAPIQRPADAPAPAPPAPAPAPEGLKRPEEAPAPAPAPAPEPVKRPEGAAAPAPAPAPAPEGLKRPEPEVAPAPIQRPADAPAPAPAAPAPAPAAPAPAPAPK